MNPRMIPLLAVLTIGVGYLTLHKPVLAERVTLQAERVRLEEQARLDQLAAESLIIDLEYQLDELRPQVPALEQALPRELRASETLHLIRENAETHAIGLEAISTSGPDRNDDLLTLTVNLTAEGAYQNTLAYLQALEQHSRPLQITSVAIDASETGQDPTLTSSITLLMHAFDPQTVDPFADPYADIYGNDPYATDPYATDPYASEYDQ